MSVRKLLLSLVMAFIFSGSFAQNTWTLEQCIDYAREKNIALAQSRLDQETADLRYNQSKFNLAPNLNAGVNYGFNFGQRIDPFTNQFATTRVESGNLFLGSSLTLFNGFSKINRLKRDNVSLKAAEAQTESVANDIAMQVCLAYLQVLQASENLEAREAQARITEQQVEQTKTFVEAGRTARGDLLQIESQLASDELEVTRAQNDVDLAYLNLTQLLQLPIDEAQSFKIVKPEIQDISGLMLESSAENIYNTALSQMPQIKAADLNVESARLDARVVEGRMSPTLSLDGSMGSGYSGNRREPTGELENLGTVPIGTVEGTGQIVNSIQEVQEYEGQRVVPIGDQIEDNFYQNLELQLSIPLFNGLSQRTNAKIAKINYESAKLSLKDAKDQLRTDVRQAYANAQAALRSYRAAEKALVSLEKAFEYAQARYDEQMLSAVEYNDSKTRYDIAKTDLIRAKYEYVFRIKLLDFYQGKPISL